MTSDAAVTGGTGLVGGHLLRRLVADGHSVTAIVRSERAARHAATDGAVPVVVDLFDGDALSDSLSGIPLLYHVAGVNDSCPRHPEELDRVNIEGTRSVVAAAAGAGVARIVYTSSAAALGEAQDTIGSESTTHSGRYLSAYARSKHLAEIAAFDAARTHGADLVAVNPSSVQGPGRSGGSARLLRYALGRRRPWLVETRLSIIDIEDCTEGHIAAAERGRGGERYVLSGATISVSDAIDIARQVAHRDIDPRWVPRGLVSGLGSPMSRIVSAIKPDAGICPALIATLLHGHRFDGSRAERELGVRYTPVVDTLARTIVWLEENGLIRRT